MSHIVISSFENTATGDLQRQGESIAVFAAEAAARAHFTERSAQLDAAARLASQREPDATFVVWVAVFAMPLEIDDVEQALEDLETVLEDAEAEGDDPRTAFDPLVLAYVGAIHEGGAQAPYSQAVALEGLAAWLT